MMFPSKNRIKIFAKRYHMVTLGRKGLNNCFTSFFSTILCNSVLFALPDSENRVKNTISERNK